jgi:O-antigen/teichoic acid export membrane protein
MKILEKIKNIHIRELVLGSSIAFVLKGIGVIFGYLFIYLITDSNGALGVGIFSLSLSVLMIFEMLGTLGFKTSILRFVGQFSAENEPWKIKSVYYSMLMMSVSLSIVLGVFFYYTSGWVAQIVFNDKGLTQPFMVMSFIIPVVCVYSINIEFIRALKEITISEYFRNVSRFLLSVIFIIGFSFFYNSNLLPILAYFTALIISMLFSLIYILIKAKPFPNGGFVSKSELFKVSIPMMITSVSFLLMGNIDKIMLGMLSTVENVGVYYVALKLATFTSFILASINSIAAPKFSELFWQKKMDSLRKIVRASSLIIFIFTFPVLLIYISLPKQIMGLFGEEFVLGWSSLVILSIGQFVNASCGSIGVFMNMTGEQKNMRNMVLVATILNITLNYMLIPLYGINGAAIATAVSMSSWNLVAVVYVSMRHKVNTFIFIFNRKVKI